MFKIEVPECNIPELDYILNVVLHDFLGFPWYTVPRNIDSLKIKLDGNIGELCMPLKLFSLEKEFDCIYFCINLVVLSLLSGLFELFKIRCVFSGINLIACSSLSASSIEHPLQNGLLLTSTILPPLPKGAL